MGDMQNLLALPISNLNKMGILTTRKIPKIVLLIISIAVVLVMFHTIMMLLQYFYMENNIEHYVRNFEGVALFTQVLGKLFSCVYNKHTYLSLTKYTTQQFWTTEKCSRTVKQSITELSHRIVFIQKLFMYLIMAGTTIALAKSIITKQLATGYWSMQNDKLFEITWITFFIEGPLIALFFGLFDCLFLGFCYEAIIQCRILYDCLERLSVKEISSDYDLKNYYKKTKSCIEQHTVLLRYHKELQKAYSFPFLVVYVTSSIFTCTEMYAISNVSSFNLLMVYGTYLMVAVFQLTFYCSTANHLSDELSTLSDAVYNSDWYSQHFKMARVPNILLNQRAQQKTTLTACGMIVMNMETLFKLFKFCLSTSVTLKGLKN